MTRLSTSEARAEAVTIVLQILMRQRMTESERIETYILALKVGADIGRADIIDELDELFLDLPEAEEGQLERDGCG